VGKEYKGKSVQKSPRLGVRGEQPMAGVSRPEVVTGISGKKEGEAVKRKKNGKRGGFSKHRGKKL